MTNTLAYYVIVVKRFDGRSDQLSERKTIKENEKFRSKEIKKNIDTIKTFFRAIFVS
jgi:hypothetical protein